MRTRLLIAMILAAAFGCEREGPPTVRYGDEACAHCRMIVNDDRFAAAVVTETGETLKFDDICCLVDYVAEKPNTAKRIWVRGYQSAQWHDAKTVYFAFGPKLHTPMGSGLAAVATEVEANALAAEWSGKTLRFDELATFLASKP